MKSALRELAADDGAATAVEYALIASAIAGVIVAIAYLLGGATANLFDDYSQDLADHQK